MGDDAVWEGEGGWEMMLLQCTGGDSQYCGLP